MATKQSHAHSVGYELNQHCCQYCGSVDRPTVDHIIPKSDFGANHISNYQILCVDCNRKKANKTFQLSESIIDFRELLKHYQKCIVKTACRDIHFQKSVVESMFQGSVDQRFDMYFVKVPPVDKVSEYSELYRIELNTIRFRKFKNVKRCPADSPHVKLFDPSYQIPKNMLMILLAHRLQSL